MKITAILGLLAIGLVFAVGSIVKNTKATNEVLPVAKTTCSANGTCSCGLNGAKTCGSNCQMTNKTCGCKK
jgi:hypothetical protein